MLNEKELELYTKHNLIITTPDIEKAMVILGKFMEMSSEEIPKPKFGMCMNLDDELDGDWSLGYNIVKFLSPNWPKFKGSVGYPVEVRQKYGLNLWEGKRGELRKELMHHLILELQSMLDERTV